MTDHTRLSDCILTALELAIAQKDVHTADILFRALEMSLTRNTGGPSFTERRTYPPAIEKAVADLEALKAKKL
jgi:hypothetical protein